MLLKLILPAVGRMFDQGTVAQWHVQEGDHVGFGDDLFDFEVHERIKVVRSLKADVITAENEEESGDPYARRAVDMRIRVTSSDVGVMRKILAGPGYARQTGEVVALLTLEEDDPMETESDAVAEAPALRVATNIIQEGGGE